MQDNARKITVLYFAWMRERVGRSTEEINLPDEVATVGDLVNWLAGRDAGCAAAFENRRTVRCAVDQAFADMSAALRGGEEVAFFPPVTGG